MIQNLIQSIKSLRFQTFKRKIQEKVMKLYKFQCLVRNLKNKICLKRKGEVDGANLFNKVHTLACKVL